MKHFLTLQLCQVRYLVFERTPPIMLKQFNQRISNGIDNAMANFIFLPHIFQ